MQKFVITGGTPLHGEVRIAGAKNAVLKEMAAAVLTDEFKAFAGIAKVGVVFSGGNVSLDKLYW